MRWADIVGYNHSNWSGYLDEGRSAPGGFDLKSFMISEGLTRVSRDRKKLCESKDLDVNQLDTFSRTKNSKEHPWRKKNDKLFTKKRGIKEGVEEDENVVTVRAGHQFEDVWGRGMTPEDIATFTEEDPEDMYLDGDIESWDEIKPGRYYVWSDAVSGEDEPEAYFGKSVDEIPWDYSFAVRSRSNPYDNEGYMLCRLDGDLSESEHQTTGPKSGYVHQGRINKNRPHSNVRTKQTGSKTYGRAKEGGLSDFEWEEHNKTAKTWVVGKDGKGHYVAPKEAGGKYNK